MTRRILAGTLVAVMASVGFSWATPGSGTSSVLVGRATFDGFKVKREAPGEDWGVKIEAKPDLDVAVQTIAFPAGSHSGWHSHPGPVFIAVVEGTMTFYDSEDPNCQPIVRQAGEGFLDTGEHAHIARNESGQAAKNVVTYFAPAGAPLRRDEPAPAQCPF